MIKFELAVQGVNRDEAENLLRQLDQQDGITIDENLFDQHEDYGAQLGSLKIDRGESQKSVVILDAYYSSGLSSNDEHLTINFWEKLAPYLSVNESHSIQKTSDRMLGLKMLKQEIESLQDVDVHFTMYTE